MDTVVGSMTEGPMILWLVLYGLGAAVVGFVLGRIRRDNEE